MYKHNKLQKQLKKNDWNKWNYLPSSLNGEFLVLIKQMHPDRITQSRNTRRERFFWGHGDYPPPHKKERRNSWKSEIYANHFTTIAKIMESGYINDVYIDFFYLAVNEFIRDQMLRIFSLKSIKLDTTGWRRRFTGNCARNWNLTIRTSGIYTTQNPSWSMRRTSFFRILRYIFSARRSDLVI